MGIDEREDTHSKLLQSLNGSLPIFFSLDILNLGEVDRIEAYGKVSYSNGADMKDTRLRKSIESVATSID